MALTNVQDITGPMTPLEKRATLSLASIYALRMFGLFLIMPVLSIYAEELEGTTPSLIGLAIGIYGITQAILQIPFGLLSDRLSRKKIIVFGLLLFFTGSVVAALSTSIYGVILGRSIQGAGAIAGAVMALVADLTQEVHRTKAMAIIGASIGMTFSVAITLGPVLADFIGLNGLFWLIAVLALLAILVIIFIVPNPQQSRIHRDAEVVPAQLSDVFANSELLRLNYGIFVLHIMLTASFVIVPLLMRNAGLVSDRHWLVYLPIFVASLAVMIPFIILAEKKRKMKAVFLGAIATLVVAELGLFLLYDWLPGVIGFLLLFFCGFNLLEATLPSLVSKTAPSDLRGTAMGIYSTSQFLGAGVGGAVGGWCYGHYGAASVFLFCAGASLTWLLLALPMKPPRHVANLLISIDRVGRHQYRELIAGLLQIVGIVEVTLHEEEAVAYLKVDYQSLDKQKLQEYLNSFGENS